jgi:5-methyltetrahydrofolate--homocysteine methyltransferase
LNFKLPLLLDGATGTNLYKAGMPSGVCVEEWVIDHPKAILDLQRAFVAAGSDVLTAPTFQANRHKLADHGYGGRVAEFNKRLVTLSREAAQGKALVAGNMAPTGLFIEPFGETTFDGLVDIFREQAFALKEAGVDYIACETFMSLPEARAALIAAKETGLPVTVTLTVDESGRTLSGGDILANLVTLAEMGAAAVGLNCSTGPEIVQKALVGIAQHIPVPLIAKPNAGVPGAEGGSLSPEQFAAFFPALACENGVSIFGGCCGTEPAHIAYLKKTLENLPCTPPCKTGDAQGEGVRDFIVANEKQAFFISEENLEFSHKIACDAQLGDRLLELDGANSAARVVIGNMDDAHEFGMNAYLAGVPVVLLGYDGEALEEAVRLYSGRALIDSKSDLPRAQLEALTKLYGAVIL